MKTRSSEDASTPAEYAVKQLASIIDSLGEVWSVLPYLEEDDAANLRKMLDSAYFQLSAILLKLMPYHSIEAQ